MIPSILRGWAWIAGSAIVAALVIGLSWISTPQVFRTSVQMQVLPPSDPQLWDDADALKRATTAEAQRIIAAVMGGEVEEAVGHALSVAKRFGLDVTSAQFRREWSEIWDQRVMVAGPVEGEIFLIVDDEDGDRGAALAEAVLEALEIEWRLRAEGFRQEGIDRLDRLIAGDMARLVDLAEQCSGLDEGVDHPGGLVLVAERNLVAQHVAESRVRRMRLESTGSDQPLPWIVIGAPLPFEHHLRRRPQIPVVISALTFVLLVGVGWVAYDRGAGSP